MIALAAMSSGWPIMSWTTRTLSIPVRCDGVVRMKIAAVVIALGGAVLPLIAQETVKGHLIEVPPVIDGEGNPIRGFKAENFEFFDDGKRQKITPGRSRDRGTETLRRRRRAATAGTGYLRLRRARNRS